MKEKVILKSTNPEEYPDLEIECLVIPREKISEYLASLENPERFYAFKSAPVMARMGTEGEKVDTILKVVVDGKEYILGEESNTVKSRICNDGETRCDIVVTNISSTSNERYIVKYDKFIKTYEFDEHSSTEGDNSSYRFIPVPEERLLTRVPENVIIMTSWGEPAICLKGSFIVAYNIEKNDYNTLDAGAFASTYTISGNPQSRI